MTQHWERVYSRSEDEAWRRRMTADVETIERLVPPELQRLHAVVVARATAAKAHALLLSGSTARGRRTAISDLDYHLIGPRIDTSDLSGELDLHVLSEERLAADVLSGDDFVQWSLRFGRVVFDDGTLRAALRLLAEQRPWPDPERKCHQAARSLDLARRVVETGDEDGALVQVRTALSLAARAFLLSNGTFPMTSGARRPARGRWLRPGSRGAGGEHRGPPFLGGTRDGDRGGAPTPGRRRRAPPADPVR